MKRRLRTRARAFVLLVGMVVASIGVTAAPAQAVFNSAGYEWRASNATVYDLSCDSPHSWEIFLYNNVSQASGELRLKLCSPENNLCDVMIGDVEIPNRCSGDYRGTTWNDHASSFNVTMCTDCYAAGGDYCILLYDNINYDRTGGRGHINIYGTGTSGSVLVNTNWNDKVSSVGRSTLC